MKFKALAIFAAASMLSSGAAHATTYISTRTIGTGSADLSITTDNTVGALTAANILSYTIKLNNLDGTFTLTQANSGKGITGGLSATATNLLFDFTANAYALFQAPNVGSGATFYCLQGGTVACFDGLGSGEAVEATSDFVFPRVARSGVQVIASVSAVPEPASWGMMILGMGAVGYAMRRRAQVSTRVAYAV